MQGKSLEWMAFYPCKDIVASLLKNSWLSSERYICIIRCASDVFVHIAMVSDVFVHIAMVQYRGSGWSGVDLVCFISWYNVIWGGINDMSSVPWLWFSHGTGCSVRSKAMPSLQGEVRNHLGHTYWAHNVSILYSHSGPREFTCFFDIAPINLLIKLPHSDEPSIPNIFQTFKLDSPAATGECP